MNIIFAILAVIIMLVGLIGSVVPILPGLPVIWLAYLGYGSLEGWQSYGLGVMIATGVAVALSLALDQLASVLGAKRLGAGWPGMIGAVVGGIVGLLILSLPGLVLGAFGGAVAGERLFGGQELKESLEAGAGALLGLLCGGLAKLVIGTVLILAFIWLVAL